MTVTTPAEAPAKSEPRRQLPTISASVWLLAILGSMVLGAIVGALTDNFLFVFTIVGLTLASCFAVLVFLPADPATKPIGKSAWQGLDSWALTSFVSACLLIPFVPLAFGHLARHRIIRRGGRGDGLALAGLIIGYVELFLIVAVAFWIWNYNEQGAGA